MNLKSHVLRCIGTDERISPDKAASDFRDPETRELYEVEYPWSATAIGGVKNLPNPSALRHLWAERRDSTLSIDQSGVWRFRDLLPILSNDDNAVTLREGNTPLYDLPRCGKSLGLDFLLAKHQGMNPTGSFKDTGMTAALSVAAERRQLCRSLQRMALCRQQR